MPQLTITRPDDWHLHVRDGAAMASVIPHTVHRFGRAIIMPNLKPPVTTVDMALNYREQIMQAAPDGTGFTPLMTLYLTDNTPAAEIEKIANTEYVVAVKYYPAGATTHSDAGVTDIAHCYDTLAAMEEHGVPLLIHGESTDPEVDVFDREQVFIEKTLIPLTQRFPQLRVVLEHITTSDAVQFIQSAPDNIGATITAHHLLYNRNAMFSGGIRPHHYCLPVLKRDLHRQALVAAAASGNPKFFLGTDSAPHSRQVKESACGCAGIYSAHAAIELYAEAFEQAGKLERLEAFASFHGADFYGMPRNSDSITLSKEPWSVPASYTLGNSELIPLRAGELVHWKLTA